MVEGELPTPVEQTTPQYEALIVLGKNWQTNRGQGFHDRASVETRLGVLAAGLALEQGLTKRVIFAGGLTGPTSEAEEMKKRLQTIFHTPGEVIFLEGESLDTIANADNVKAKLSGLNIDSRRCALATVDFHTGRAGDIFRSRGMEFAQIFSSEELIRQHHGGHSLELDSILKKYEHTPRVALEKIREGIAQQMFRLDSQGNLQRWLSSIFRKKGK